MRRVVWVLAGVAVCVASAVGLAAAQAPAAASIARVAAGDGALTVVWTAPSGVADIVAYDLRYIAGDAADKADDNWSIERAWESGPLHYVLAGLTNGAGYDIQVRAVTASEGAWSATATGTPANHGTEEVSATALELGVPTGGFMQSASDRDVFSVTMPERGSLLVYTTGAAATWGRLWRSYPDGSNPLLLRAAVPGDPITTANNMLIWPVRDLDAGTYHIAVAPGPGGATGAYVLHTEGIFGARTFDDPEIVGVGSVTAGVFNHDRRAEYFKLVLTEQTDLLIRSTGIVPDTVGVVYNDRNEWVTQEDGSYLAQPRHFAIRARLEAGDHYIWVSYDNALGPDGFGPWLLHVEEVVEPGSTLSTAAPLALGATVGGRIDPSDDVDYLRIDVDETAYVVIAAHGESAGIGGGLLDVDGNAVGASQNRFVRSISRSNKRPGIDPSGIERFHGFEIRRTLVPGTYYLRVDTQRWETFDSPAAAATGAYTAAVWEDEQYLEMLASCGAGGGAVPDPLYGCQWNLRNTGQSGGTAGEDINVEPAWLTTMGAGVGVAVVDTGVDHGHEDLVANVDPARSRDYTRRGQFLSYNTHGTNVAGLVAASDNEIGLRGTAPRATVYSFNWMLNSTLFNLGDAMTRASTTTAVSSNSWVPGHSPVAYRASRLWEKAVESGLRDGNSGLGTVYVFAAGNSHELDDNSNLSEYSNFYGVTAVCAVNVSGRRSVYSEMGANLWVCAPAGDDAPNPGITTTDNLGRYDYGFSGTSAATPQVSGVVALVRSASPTLTWRDVKLILAGSARKNDPVGSDWQTGAAKYEDSGENYEFNHAYGFGVVDAKAAVDLAQSWTNVPAMATETAAATGPALTVPDTAAVVSSTAVVGTEVQFVEFVEVNVVLDGGYREIDMELVSPSGAVSQMMVYSDPGRGWNPMLRAEDGPFRLGSARHLGEDPRGEWRLRLADRVPGWNPIELKSWSITVYGHRSTPGPPEIVSLDGVDVPLTVSWEAPETAGKSDVTAFDLRYIASAATDKGDSRWMVIDDAWTSGPLSYTVTGLTSGTDYDFAVRAVSLAGDGAWSPAVSGRLDEAARSPRFASAEDGLRSVAENTAAGVDIGAPLVAADPDGTAPVYSLSGIDAAAFDVVAATGQLRTEAPLNHETQRRYDFVMTATDPTDRSDEIAVTVTVDDVNEPPVLSGLAEIFDNESELVPRLFLGDLDEQFVAVDPEGLTLDWSLEGPDADLFDLVSLSYWHPVCGDCVYLRYLELPDFENPHDEGEDNVYDVTINASDGMWDVRLPVVRTVLDNDEPPELSGDSTASFVENGADEVRSYSARDPEGNDVRWSLEGVDKARFSIEGGVLRFLAPPDFEAPADDGADNVYDVEVHVGDGLRKSRLEVEVLVSNADEDGRLELSAAPVVGAELSAVLSDPDGGVSTVAWQWERRAVNASSWTAIAGAESGAYTPVEADLGMFLQVTAAYDDAHSSGKSAQEQTAAVSAAPPANLAPRFPADETGRRVVSENADAGEAVGAPVAADDPEGDSLTYALGGDDAALFEIVAATGQVRTRTVLDREADSSYSVVVSVSDAKDADGNADPSADDTVAVAVAVADVDEVPTLEGPASVEFAENDTVAVAAYSADDPEDRSVAWSLSGPDLAFLSISSGGSLAFMSPPDYEARRGSVYRVTVRAYDGLNAVTRNVTVTVTDVNEPPTLSGKPAVGFEENGRGEVAAYDADDPERQALSWSLGGDDAGDFTVSAAGVVHFAESVAPPDFEDPDDSDTDNEYRVVVQVSDGLDPAGDADPAIDDSLAVVVTVTGVNEPPVLSGRDLLDHDENDSGEVGAFEADDPEGVVAAWSLRGADATDFAVSAAGVVRFAESVAPPDFEDPDDSDRDNEYRFAVGAFDGSNTVWRNVKVTVTNVDEPGTVELLSLQPQVGTELDAVLSDPDGAVSDVSWQWESSIDPSVPSGWSDISGATARQYTPGDTDMGRYLRVRADPYRDPQGAGKSAWSEAAAQAVKAAPVGNRAPAFPASETGARSVVENAGAGERVGAPVSAVDPDGADGLTYSLSGADAGSFEIDAATGQLRTRKALDRESPDREPPHLHRVTVTVMDSSRESDTVTVTVTVTDVDEAPVLSGPSPVIFEEARPGRQLVSVYSAADPESVAVTWSLSGADEAAFTIVGGHLEFRDPPDFDRPVDSGGDNEYRVVVVASDGSLSTGLAVRVVVTGVDEAPAVSGHSFAERPENEVEVGRYSALDPEGAAVTVSLEGVDKALLTLTDDGLLRFKQAPDYEQPADTGPNGRDNVYEVVVEAADTGGRTTAYLVKVRVVDADDFGTVTLSAEQPSVAAPLTAVLNDPDGEVSAVAWRWERSEDRADWSEIDDSADSAVYTPAAPDLGLFLRATATYTDRHGPDRTAGGESRLAVAEQHDRGPAAGPVAVVGGVGGGGGGGGGDDGPVEEQSPVDQFSDLDDAGVHEESVRSLVADGVMDGTGCGGGGLCPREALLRWEMAVWLVRVIDGADPESRQRSRFGDVDGGAWWIPHVERLAELEVTLGCSAEPAMFCPGKPVTRAQMASFLVRAFDLARAPSAGFEDASGSVHAANIDSLFSAKITVGCVREPLSFCPLRPTTRAQMATFLRRAELALPGSDPPALGAALWLALENGAGAGGGGRVSGPVYTWEDGDRTLRVWLQQDLALRSDGAITEQDEVLKETPRGSISRQSQGAATGGQPVFLSASGELMTLPGGVVLLLDPLWSADRVDAFLAGNGIAPDRVSELDWIDNGFLVQTGPGFASLELANALAGQDGVEFSSPNWWTDRAAN